MQKPEETASVTRRQFLELSAAAAVVAAGSGGFAWAAEVKQGIPYRTLGRTGEKVSLVGVGGSHIGMQKDEQESIRIIRGALDRGINFLDNSWDYNDGKSEERMGKALRDGYRQKAFLMTKIDGRTRESAAKQLDESLKRLQVDHVDLLQFHEIIRMNDPDRIFAPGGALEAVLAAKKAGKVRYVGFTGHKDPKIHLHMIETADAHQFQFDTVQMPLNVMDAHFKSFGTEVLPVALKHQIAVLGMKPMGDHFILDSKAVTAVECLHYAMNLPVSVVITGIDSLPILDQAVNAAKSFQPLNGAQVSALLARTQDLARNGQFELYKTSHHFDTTEKKPQYLG
jgi:predicted aldo/keto reductase-like oxidoreductase